MRSTLALATFALPRPSAELHHALRPEVVRTEDPVRVAFRTREVSQGVLEEDGEIWSRDGRLLVHSRQLAILLAQ